MKKYIYVTIGFLILYSCTPIQNKPIVIDQEYINDGILEITKQYTQAYPEYHYFILLNDMYVPDEIKSAPDEQSFYMLMPLYSFLFEEGEYGHKRLLPISCFIVNDKTIFVQSSSDMLFNRDINIQCCQSMIEDKSKTIKNSWGLRISNSRKVELLTMRAETLFVYKELNTEFKAPVAN